jgi:hypothetical protein
MIGPATPGDPEEPKVAGAGWRCRRRGPVGLRDRAVPGRHRAGARGQPHSSGSAAIERPGSPEPLRGGSERREGKERSQRPLAGARVGGGRVSRFGSPGPGLPLSRPSDRRPGAAALPGR